LLSAGVGRKSPEPSIQSSGIEDSGGVQQTESSAYDDPRGASPLFRRRTIRSPMAFTLRLQIGA